MHAVGNGTNARNANDFLFIKMVDAIASISRLGLVIISLEKSSHCVGRVPPLEASSVGKLWGNSSVINISALRNQGKNIKVLQVATGVVLGLLLEFTG